MPQYEHEVLFRYIKKTQKEKDPPVTDETDVMLGRGVNSLAQAIGIIALESGGGRPSSTATGRPDILTMRSYKGTTGESVAQLSLTFPSMVIKDIELPKGDNIYTGQNLAYLDVKYSSGATYSLIEYTTDSKIFMQFGKRAGIIIIEVKAKYINIPSADSSESGVFVNVDAPVKVLGYDCNGYKYKYWGQKLSQDNVDKLLKTSDCNNLKYENLLAEALRAKKVDFR